MPEEKKDQIKSPISEAPTQAVWEELLHVAIVGNGIFPQSFWAQGVLLADKITELVNNGAATWDFLLESDPPSDLTNKMLGEARGKSHSAYGFETRPSMTGGTTPLLNVWETGRLHAKNFLFNMAHAINSNIPRQKPVAHYKDAIEEVTSDPEKFLLLKELLKAASQSLSDGTIKELSVKYKMKISEFMQKYAPYSFSNIPKGYKEEQELLDQELESILRNASSLTQQRIINLLEGEHPQHTALLETIKSYEPNKLFGGVRVARIHPLKNPDYD